MLNRIKLLILILVCAYISSCAQDSSMKVIPFYAPECLEDVDFYPPAEVDLPDDGEEFIIGGSKGFRVFICSNMRDIDSVKSGIVRGVVLVSVEVDSNGIVTDYSQVTTIEGCKKCSEEAMRMIRSVPRWKPPCFLNKTKDKIICQPTFFLAAIPFPCDYVEK